MSVDVNRIAKKITSGSLRFQNPHYIIKTDGRNVTVYMYVSAESANALVMRNDVNGLFDKVEKYKRKTMKDVIKIPEVVGIEGNKTNCWIRAVGSNVVFYDVFSFMFDENVDALAAQDILRDEGYSAK